MKLFNKILWFLKAKLLSILLLIITVVALFSISWLYNVSLVPATYTASVLVGFYLLFLLIEYHHFDKKYKSLQIIKQQSNTFLGEPPKTFDIIERQYLDIIVALEEKWQKLKSQSYKNEKNLTEYYTLWSHQIKTPISAINLLLQENEPDFKAIETELFKIEQYVDMALKYTDLDNTANDLVINKYSLEKIVKNALKRTKVLFIQKKISVELSDNLDKLILTDEKWLTFVLEQLLTNACKYTQAGAVSIYMLEDNLIIEDTGIGIKKEDISRIFEWGYTGYNGRENRSSTGIGLFLCKKALTMLGNSISITSELDVGTKAIIDLKRDEFEIE